MRCRCDFHQAQILLSGKRGFCRFFELWGGDHFQKKFVHFFGSRGIKVAIYPYDAAEGGYGIALEGAHVGFRNRLPDRKAARVGVFDDGAGRFVEFLRQVPGALQVDDIVVGKFFALNLLGIGHAETRTIGVHRRLLVRVLAVAQVAGLLE